MEGCKVNNLYEKIPECFYRVSIKALVLNESRDKFLLIQEGNGFWELPGGGLDWGMSPQEDVPREIDEEMGVGVTYVAAHPSYFLTFENKLESAWIANVVYEVQLDSLDFTSSDECMAIRFVDKDTVKGLKLNQNIIKLLDMFDRKKHAR